MNSNIPLEYSATQLKALRQKTGLTQEAFCETFGLNINTYRHWERGDRKPAGASLVLLNLIADSWRGVLSLQHTSHSGTDTMSQGKLLLKSAFERRECQTLEAFLIAHAHAAAEACEALIRANGFPYVETRSNGETIEYHAGYAPDNMKTVLSVSPQNQLIEGELKNVIGKTYQTAYAIEEELKDAVYWTPAMRAARVDEIITRIGIDGAFYNNILRNW